MHKYTCSLSWHELHVAFKFFHLWPKTSMLRTMSTKFSPLRLVSSFWLSGHLFLAMQFISEFIWVATCQAKTITVVLPLIPLISRDRNTARANQSASQDCRLATNQRLKSADLRHRGKKPRRIWSRVTKQILTMTQMAPGSRFVISIAYFSKVSPSAPPLTTLTW